VGVVVVVAEVEGEEELVVEAVDRVVRGCF
jgi:hypothetical protein